VNQTTALLIALAMLLATLLALVFMGVKANDLGALGIATAIGAIVSGLSPGIIGRQGSSKPATQEETQQ
jgi:hypothetical protein